MKQKMKQIIRAGVRISIFILLVATVIIVAWEQVDDMIENKWQEITTTNDEEFISSTSTPTVELKNEEEKRIEEIMNSSDAQKALEAYAKGVYAEELRKKAESLAEESRSATTSF